MPKITVVTPTYNSEKTIKDTLEALLRQSFSDFEYIVIDGASKDNTVNIIESYRQKFADKGVPVTIVSEPDKGVYDAMNKGINLAKGELIGLNNSDDWYEDHTLELIWTRFTQPDIDKNNTMIYGIERVWKNDKVQSLQCRGADFISEGVMPHCTFFVPKTVYEAHGVFDLSIRILADHDFLSRCSTEGVRFVRLDAVLSNFRLGGLSSSSYFDFYLEYFMVQRKRNYISEKEYKRIVFKLKAKRFIEKISKTFK